MFDCMCLYDHIIRQNLNKIKYSIQMQDDIYRDNIGESLKCAELRMLMTQYKGKRDVLVDAQSKLDEVGNLQRC